MMWAHPAFLRRIVGRSVGIWIAVRMTMAFYTSFVGGQAGFAVPLHVALEIVVIMAAVAYFDTARRHELLILANLGVAKGTVVLLVTAPVALLEAVMMVVF